MRCKDFDAQIEELLAGILHPDASQHMRQCERCTSYFRARSAVESGLRTLASAPVQGPSRATDRAVMESYRRLQGGMKARPPQSTGRVVAFPGHLGSSPAARTRWSGLAVAAALLAMVGSGIHLWTGAPTVSAPSVASAPAVSQTASAVSGGAAEAGTLAAETLASDNGSRSAPTRQLQAKLVSGRASRSVATQDVAGAMPAEEIAGGTAANDAATAQSAPGAANSIMHLASAGGATAGGVGRSAGSSWPGYSDLMYCDPVVCSGPMQVVRIKVPVGQGKPGAGKIGSNSFVNAEVVVGPDGVARAIRVAN